MITQNDSFSSELLIEFIKSVPEGLELVPVKDKTPKNNGPDWQTKRYSKRICERKVREKDANGVGVMLGKGWLVLDIDGTNGKRLVEAIAGMPYDEALPPTLCHWSSHRPDHLKYLVWVGDQIDFKGKKFTEWGAVTAVPGEQLELLYTGRQAVLPFSYHPGDPEKGIESGVFHNWNVAPDTDAAMETPQWIISLVQSLAEPKPKNPNPSDYLNAEFGGDSEASEAYVAAALESECQKVSNAPEGSRNDILNTAAYNLGSLIDQGLAEDKIRRRLLSCATIAGIGKTEANKTISSGIKAGKKNTRKAKEKEEKGLEGSKLANVIADMWQDKVCYTSTTRSFYRYSDGIWKQRDDEDILADIQEVLDDGIVENYNHKTAIDQLNLLKGKLRKDVTPMPRHLLPFKNGVLNTLTQELTPHSPKNWFTNKFPHEYNREATCPLTLQVLKEILIEDSSVLLARSCFKATVMGWVHLHKYVELIGVPGSGKSTMLKIVEALVGRDWTISKVLRFLESGRFETASLKDKRLLIISDAERYTGDVSVLKMITGQDPLPFERKFENPGEPFKAECIPWIASNHALESDESSALERRRITFIFEHQIPDDKRVEILELNNDGTFSGLLANEIPGIMNWVLDLPDDEAIKTLKNPLTSLTQAKAKLNNLLATNKIAEWAFDCLVMAPGYLEHVGSIPEPNTAPSVTKAGMPGGGELYPSYALWATHRNVKPPSVKKFVSELDDLLRITLKLDVQKKRNNRGSGFLGVATRDLDKVENRINPLVYALIRPFGDEAMAEYPAYSLMKPHSSDFNHPNQKNLPED